MPLSSGTRIGSYEIVAPLGAGAGLEFGPPRRLFEALGVFVGIAGYSGNYRAWAVSGDRQRFCLQQRVQADRPVGLAPLLVIMNHPAVRPTR